MFDPQKPLGVKPPKKPKQLTTVQYALLVEAIAEGEIEGFPAPITENFKLGSFNYNQAAKKNIFLNGTPILRPSADLSVLDDDGLVDIDDGHFIDYIGDILIDLLEEQVNNGTAIQN